MKDLIMRLTSRTFWMAVGTVIALMSNKQYPEAASVAAAYILGEKARDTLKQQQIITTDSENDESHNMAGGLVTGSGRVKTDDEDAPGLETGQ